jgi:hypothetical protein
MMISPSSAQNDATACADLEFHACVHSVAIFATALVEIVIHIPFSVSSASQASAKTVLLSSSAAQGHE